MVMAGACSSDSPVAVADYRREMNSVCRTTHAAVARIPEADAGDPTALPKAGRRALIAQRDAVRALRAVRVSPQSAPAVRKWLALVQHALDSVDSSL